MIGGCEVRFPHQPYGVQFLYMSKLLHALDEKGANALLEVRLLECQV